ncbi:MAG: HU family DNA-binding protein [Phycisphaerales bacterium]|nr:HU family DNA-binding protein [Phycisphaerales bacterium]
MNKRQLIEAVARELATTKTAASTYVDAVLHQIVEGIREEDKVAISGFGTFRRRSRKSRRIINPSSGDMMTLPRTMSVGFTPSQVLKDAITGEEESEEDATIREVKPEGQPALVNA